MIKQVIVIRRDLHMRKGKMIAQGAHASLKVFLDLLKPTGNKGDGFVLSLTEEMQQWIEGDYRKIVLYVQSERELLDIYEQALLERLPCTFIQDHGLTEFQGEKTYTAVAIGPASGKRIDNITGHLPLL